MRIAVFITDTEEDIKIVKKKVRNFLEKILNLKKNLEFFFKIVLIISLIFIISMKVLGKEQEWQKKKI